MTGTLILASMLFLCLIGCVIAFISYSFTENLDLKLRREIFQPGRKVKTLRCVSVNFNEYEIDSMFIILDVINDEAKIMFADGGTEYKHLSNIGTLADRIEVYENNGHLVGVYEHEANTGILYMNFLHKK